MDFDKVVEGKQKNIYLYNKKNKYSNSKSKRYYKQKRCRINSFFRKSFPSI